VTEVLALVQRFVGEPTCEIREKQAKALLSDSPISDSK
jgi:hypothetical protein